MSQKSDLRFFTITFEDEISKIGSTVFSNTKDIEKYHDFFDINSLIRLNYHRNQLTSFAIPFLRSKIYTTKSKMR